mmetsp:Transcript_23431/g.25670  ORF Transcript_23431/g.25670 Transcript_23431/m.25670 type:complete len:151 (+) Transcript_23431:87-539(+)
MFAVARFQRLAVSKIAGISKKSLSTIKFSQSHEYIKVVGDIGTVGITQHAADALGDVVYVELPAKGTQYTAGSSFGSVESVKAASDVYAPVSGEVIEVNEGLGDTPSLVNESPLEKGWFIKLKLSNAGKAEFTKLLDQAAYEKHVEESAH